MLCLIKKNPNFKNKLSLCVRGQITQKNHVSIMIVFKIVVVTVTFPVNSSVATEPQWLSWLCGATKFYSRESWVLLSHYWKRYYLIAKARESNVNTLVGPKFSIVSGSGNRYYLIQGIFFSWTTFKIEGRDRSREQSCRCRFGHS